MVQDADWSATVAGHKQRQLLKIGKIAAELVSSDGLGAVSMSRLARASGVSRATLYNYVPDVVSAVREYLTAQSDAFQATVAAAVAEEEDPEAQLRRYIEEQVAYAAGADHRAAAALLESGAALGGSDPAAHQRRDFAVLQGILDRGERDGTFRPGHQAARLTLISRLLYSSHELMQQQQVSRDDTVALITDLILGGIRR
ncbi:TetR/AcrR family transcriptional regulator [Flexivirga sp. B27]